VDKRKYSGRQTGYCWLGQLTITSEKIVRMPVRSSRRVCYDRGL